MAFEHEDGVVWLRVPLDADTAWRLKTLADICQAGSTSVAASLLHDILLDDDLAHDEHPTFAALN